MTVWTTKPGIQLYTGNFLFGQKGKDGKEYKLRSGVCLETGGLPDAVNRIVGAEPPGLVEDDGPRAGEPGPRLDGGVVRL